MEFSKARSVLSKLGASVAGVSGGDGKSKKRFCDKHGLNLLLLSDPDFSTSDAYGAYVQKSFMGKSFWGIARKTFVIDLKARRVLKAYDKVSPALHAKEIEDFLKNERRSLSAPASLSSSAF